MNTAMGAPFKKIFVGGINFNTTEDELRTLFSGFGTITQLRLIRDRETGKSRGFAFITYSNEQDAFNALLKLDGYELDGRRLGVKVGREKPL